MSKINTNELKSLLAQHAAAQAELTRLQELETKLQADHARSLTDADAENDADVTRLAFIAARLALMPATITKAEARLADADKALKREACTVAKALEGQRITERKALFESATAALRPFYAGEHLAPEMVETLPIVKAAAERQSLAGHWSVNGGNSSGSELCAAVLAGIGG